MLCSILEKIDKIVTSFSGFGRVMKAFKNHSMLPIGLNPSFLKWHIKASLIWPWTP